MQVLAAPFAAGALYLDTPHAYFSLIPAYTFGTTLQRFNFRLIKTDFGSNSSEATATRLRVLFLPTDLFVSRDQRRGMDTPCPRLTGGPLASCLVSALHRHLHDHHQHHRRIFNCSGASAAGCISPCGAWHYGILSRYCTYSGVEKYPIGAPCEDTIKWYLKAMLVAPDVWFGTILFAASLYSLFPGLYLLATMVFSLGFFSLGKDIPRGTQREYEAMN